MASRKSNTDKTSKTSTANIGFEAKLWLTVASEGGSAEKDRRSVGMLGRGYAYFLTRFASAEGKNGGPEKCEVRSASVEVKNSRPFGIRNPAFDISPARCLAFMNLAFN